MRRSAIIGLLFLAASGSAYAQAAYTAPEGDFSAAFPAAPTVNAEAPATRNDPGFRSYLVEQDGRAFLVSIDEYPQAIPVPSPSPVAYTLLLRAHAKETSATLSQTREVSIAGRKAMEGSYLKPDGGLELRRVLMVGRQVFQVSFSGPAGGEAEGQAFVESFRPAN